MASKAEEIMTRQPACVAPTQKVSDAVEIMKNEDCGVVPVVDSKSGGALVGIITDRDIALRACSDGSKGPATTISEVMTTNLFCVAPHDSIERVRQVMSEGGVRRVPVVENDRLVGIISMKDLSDESSARVVGETDESILGQAPNN